MRLMRHTHRLLLSLSQNLVIIADRKSLPTADFHFLLRLRRWVLAES